MSRWLKASAEIKYVVKRKQYDPFKGTQYFTDEFDTVSEAYEFYKKNVINDKEWYDSHGNLDSEFKTEKPQLMEVFEIDQTGEHKPLTLDQLKRKVELQQAKLERDRIKQENKAREYYNTHREEFPDVEDIKDINTNETKYIFDDGSNPF